MIPLLPVKLADEQLERVRRNHADAIGELQKLPSSAARIVYNVSLADGVSTPIAHGLGRRPTFVSHSVVRGASTTGRIVETNRDDRFVYLTAADWGATITIDVEVQ